MFPSVCFGFSKRSTNRNQPSKHLQTKRYIALSILSSILYFFFIFAVICCYFRTKRKIMYIYMYFVVFSIFCIALASVTCCDCCCLIRAHCGTATVHNSHVRRQQIFGWHFPLILPLFDFAHISLIRCFCRSRVNTSKKATLFTWECLYLFKTI